MASAYKVVPLGERVEHAERIYEFSIVPTNPDNVEVSGENTELITIQSYYEIISEGTMFYQPHINYYFFDNLGNRYKPVYYELVESENWKAKLSLRGPGKVVMKLTYEVPKEAERIIFWGYHNFMPKDGALIVEIPTEGSESAKLEEK